MFKAKIEGGKEAEYLEFPCDQETLNEKTDGGDDEIKISFFGESEFEKKLISLIREYSAPNRATQPHIMSTAAA